MIETSIPWLSLLVAIPALGALAVGRLADRERARAAALGVAALTTALAGWVTLEVSRAGPGALLVDPLTLAALGARRPSFGVDAFSAAPILLFCLLTVAVVAGLPVAAASPPALGRVLLVCASNLGLYASLDLGLLAALWLASLAPLARSFRADAAGRAARRVFLIYQGAAAGCLLAAVVVIAARGQGEAPLFIPELAPAAAAGAVGPLLVAATLLRKGTLPVHSWVPALFEGTSPGVAGLFVSAHAGVYLFVRVGLLRLGDPLREAMPLVAGVAMATALYAALLALAQRDLRRLLGFLAMSQSSFVLVGFLCAGTLGPLGGLMGWLTVGVALVGLALASGCLEARFGPVDLRQPRGYAARMPRLSTLFLVLGLACCGLPGLAGFVSEDLLFHALLESHPAVGVAMALATALNGYTLLRAYFHAFQGFHAFQALGLPPVGDLHVRERLALKAMLVLLLGFGLFPGPVIATRVGPAAAIAERTRAPEPEPPAEEGR